MSAAPRVLIVEDQYFVAVDCELQLRSVGIDCVGLATTAAEALDIAEREHPDFALMDIRLASVSDIRSWPWSVATRREEPEHALACIPVIMGRPGHLLMDNRKEASCVTVAGDRMRPRGRVWVSRMKCLLRGEFAASAGSDL